MPPEPTWFLENRRRLLEGDPTAPAELLEEVFLPLKQTLKRRNPRLRDEHLIDDAVTEALIDYLKMPEKFDPGKAGLLAYLEMAAQGDLKNMIAKRRRRSRRLRSLELVELHGRGGKEGTDAHDATKTIEAQELSKRISQHFSDPMDLELVELIVAQERSTESYAEVLGIQDLPIEDQRREVKRHKDRIKKRLRQLGTEFRNEK